ncbi:MAG: TIGR01777 family oxidoreductase [Armatimonadetes bacterium]|nr:TIGR01777 family oxidoreductase [Armatimonadota bacterium]
MGRVVIAGGTGFLGRAAVSEFKEAGYDVVVLSRSGKVVDGAEVVRWDPNGAGDWYSTLEGAHAVVNLCGESLLQRWTPKALKAIRESRLGTTAVIGAAVGACKEPPKVWVNMSAVGFYGNTGQREVSEASPSANDFLGKLCQEWEDEVDKAVTPATRKVKVRGGLILGQGGQPYETLCKVTKMFLGGPLGSGAQYMPWIHVRDFARLLLWAVQGDVRGAVNATAPKPVTNAVFMDAMRAAIGRPPAPPAPAFAVESVCKAMGWDPNMLLGGTRAVPAIPLANGFEFEFGDLHEALRDIVDDVPHAWRTQPASA